MTQDPVTGPPDPSHDDLSNPGPNRARTPPAENEAHDRNDDGDSAAPRARDGSTDTGEQQIPGKPISDMAPPGQDS